MYEHYNIFQNSEYRQYTTFYLHARTPATIESASEFRYCSCICSVPDSYGGVTVRNRYRRPTSDWLPDKDAQNNFFSERLGGAGH